jgi:hypothetical protein
MPRAEQRGLVWPHVAAPILTGRSGLMTPVGGEGGNPHESTDAPLDLSLPPAPELELVAGLTRLTVTNGPAGAGGQDQVASHCYKYYNTVNLEG